MFLIDLRRSRSKTNPQKNCCNLQSQWEKCQINYPFVLVAAGGPKCFTECLSGSVGVKITAIGRFAAIRSRSLAHKALLAQLDVGEVGQLVNAPHLRFEGHGARSRSAGRKHAAGRSALLPHQRIPAFRPFGLRQIHLAGQRRLG